MTDQTAETTPAEDLAGTDSPADPGPVADRSPENQAAAAPEDAPAAEAAAEEQAAEPPAAEGGPAEAAAEQQDTLVEMPKTDDIPGALEALLLLAEEPMSETVLAQAVGAPVHVVSDALAELVAFYDETGRGFELRQLGGGWRYYTRAEHADLIAGHVLDGAQSRLSQAALETLAVIAYLQPISRSRVSAIRGVNVDGVIRTLLARGLIVEAGADAESGAVVFATTDYFLERMGLSSLEQLPELAPHLPEASELEAELSQFATISQAAEAGGPTEAVPPGPEAPGASASSDSPASAGSPDSPDSPASPDSPESPASPSSPDSPSEPDSPSDPDSDDSESTGSAPESESAESVRDDESENASVDGESAGTGDGESSDAAPGLEPTDRAADSEAADTAPDAASAAAPDGDADSRDPVPTDDPRSSPPVPGEPATRQDALDE
ncbi:SMC-Scp complex subunit ScpB [Microlunatus parietis]|uniref:Segregation and condensation protein B n=1 Tax=Microlunatus parietis TaxID=682979 RepID=A0A7Y9I3L9_9ACTN|nr:SMC-Scp complex subunit ScpB [Microlunatus parietis]NYE69607.1 segregation and condensation protein B [Microlunatus parietis]